MITGNVHTCPEFEAIFLCKYCEKDNVCGEQIGQMSTEDIKDLYSFLEVKY